MAGAARTVTIVVDDSAARASLARMNQQLNQMATGQGRGAAATQNAARAQNAANRAVQGGTSSLGQLSQSLAAANGNTARLAGSLGNLRGIAGSASTALGGVARLAGPLAIGIGAVVGAMALLSGPVLEASAAFEKMKANLVTVTGDVDSAGRAFVALQDFAAKTPFSLDQSVNGFIKLKALGLQPTEAAMTSYGNTASAMGKDMNQMIEAVADASVGEFERLKEFGIKSKSEGDKVSFTFGGVTKTVGKNSAEIQAYLQDLGNTKFAGAMERQMATVGGAMVNFKDQITNAFAALGEGGMSAAFSRIFNDLSNGFKSAMPLIKSFGNLFGGIIDVIWDVASSVGMMFGAITAGAPNGVTFMESLTFAVNLVGEGFRFLGDIVRVTFTVIANIVGGVVGFVRNLFGNLFGWLIPATTGTGQSMGASFIGVLRSVKFVVNQIPALFAAAFNDVMRMGKQFGAAIAAAMTGDFSGFGKIFAGSLKGAFAGTQKVMGDTVGGVYDRMYDPSNETRLQGMLGRDSVSADWGSFDAAGGSPSSAAKANKGTKGGKSDAEREAERLKKLEEERAKKMAEFWQKLDEGADANRLYGLELEKHNKTLELRKIFGDGDLKNARDLTLEEATRLDLVLKRTALNKILTDMDKQSRDDAESIKKLEFERNALLGGSADFADDELRVFEKLAPIKRKLLEDAGGLMTEEVRLSMARAEADERSLIALEKRNGALRDGISLADELAGDALTPKQQAEKKYNDQVATLFAGRDAIDPEKYAAALDQAYVQWQKSITEIDSEFYSQMSNSVQMIADAFGGKIGGAIGKIAKALEGLAAVQKGEAGGLVGGIIGFFGGKESKVSMASQKSSTDFTKSFFSGDTWSKPFDSISSGIAGTGKDLKNIFSKGGDFQQGLGSVLGKLGAGAQIGSAVGGISDALGLGLNSTGAQIGGALGGLAGPVGAIAGSIAGGILGSVLAKKKYGTVGLTLDEDGRLVSGDVMGNSKGAKKAALAGGGAVADGINGIADALGADISGAPRATIGTYKDKWRVSSTGRTGKLKGKYGDVKDFGKEGQAEAVAYAVNLALKQGILTGISDFSKRLVQSKGSDGVELAASFENLLKDLSRLKDPLGGALEDLSSGLDRMVTQMQRAGATADELAKVEEFRNLKLVELKEGALATLKDFRADLNKEEFGTSKLAQFYEAEQAYQTIKDKIARGEEVTQEDFAAKAGSYLDLATIFGVAGSKFQGIKSDVTQETDAFISRVEARFTDNEVKSAIVEQTNILSGQLAIMTDLLRTGGGGIAAGSGGAGLSEPNFSSPLEFAVNGRMGQSIA